MACYLKFKTGQFEGEKWILKKENGLTVGQKIAAASKGYVISGTVRRTVESNRTK
jgi:hypothetical protein